MGPLQGVRVIEMAGLAPGPFCAMMLADMGAEVIRVDRPGEPAAPPGHEVLARGRRSAAIDLKSAAGREACLRLIERADALIEGHRPGVMERLGLGPEAVHARAPRLVYGRLTGWGQDGPLAATAGHDIDYIALSGALHAIGEAGGKPVPPLNLVGDFGGGAMMMAFGLVTEILEELGHDVEVRPGAVAYAPQLTLDDGEQTSDVAMLLAQSGQRVVTHGGPPFQLNK